MFILTIFSLPYAFYNLVLETVPYIPNFQTHLLFVLINIHCFSTQGTNSYLVGSETEPRILIDTTGGDVSNKIVPDSEPPISEILLTHWHPDHTEGIEASPEGPNLKSIGYYGGPLNMLDESMTFSPPKNPSIKLKPIFTPGHSVDHMCFAMYVNDNVECVFVGDLLLGKSSSTYDFKLFGNLSMDTKFLLLLFTYSQLDYYYFTFKLYLISIIIIGSRYFVMWLLAFIRPLTHLPHVLTYLAFLPVLLTLFIAAQKRNLLL
ncbi:unnamed protein product [Rodentolepis nana]|uniref:Lactamase_B domain-containing protein n=1 Tax=Rodentolepis nana TaxID=102285 RepID=A0A0R3TYM3_RODNA|nr:unnamed protein product [Rodentolepis nana]